MRFQGHRKPDFRISLTFITTLLVCIIAVFAGASLWLLQSMHSQLAHATATRAVLEHGKLITARIADQPVVRSASTDDPAWRQFSRLVNGLHALETGLQYVSVARDGVTVFHEQMTALDASETAKPGVSPTNLSSQIALSRRVLKVGKENVPVVIFNTAFPGDDGKPRTVEIAIRKDTVGREEETAANAITSMFRVSLVTTVVSFSICVVLVAWMMQREIRREKHIREQEHLVFAGVLANGIAHDFRNPMSSLKLDMQMLEKEASKGKQCNFDRLSELAGRARTTMDRMDKVFQEFLYLSKPQADRTVTINLGVCLADCLEMLSGSFEQAGVTIEKNVVADNLDIAADQTSIRRAIVNILTNALQFSKKGDKVRVRLAHERDRAILEISDQGPGVQESERKRIFEMFVSSRPGGIGLGLFLAKTAVDMAGGNINVTGAEGGGSCFQIVLPLVTARGKGSPPHEKA